MAPDLNSVPASPRNASATTALPASAPSSRPRPSSRQSSQPTSRRASQIFLMSPPPLPLATPGGTIPTSAQSTHHPFPPLSPSVSGTIGGPTTAHTSVDAAGVPMRHPRPLTAAELHLELEKEQEAVVCSSLSASFPLEYVCLALRISMVDDGMVTGQPPNPRTLLPPRPLRLRRLDRLLRLRGPLYSFLPRHLRPPGRDAPNLATAPELLVRQPRGVRFWWVRLCWRGCAAEHEPADPHAFILEQCGCDAEV